MAATDNPDQKKKPLDANDPHAKDKAGAQDKLSREAQGTPVTAKERDDFKAVDKIAHDANNAFKANGASDADAHVMLTKFLTAPTNAERNKLFNGAVPKSIQDFENTYKENTTATILHAIDVAKGKAPENASRQQAPAAPQRVEAPVARPAPVVAPARTEAQVSRPAPVAPVDQTRVTDARVAAPAAATAGDPLGTMNDASRKMHAAVELVQAVKPDGTPLTAAQKQVFQSAIDAGAKVTPAVIGAAEAQLLGQMAPGWTVQNEKDYQAVNKNADKAFSALTEAHRLTLQKLPKEMSIEQKTAALDQLNDPATPAFKQAIADKQAFYDANAAKVKERNQKEDPMPQLLAMEAMQHFPAFGNFVYSAALSQTKNPGDAAQAKAVFARADQDPGLKDVVPQLDKAREQITGVRTRQEVQAAPGAPAASADPLDALVPGRAETRAAAEISRDPSLSPEQRYQQSSQLYEKALQIANGTDYSALDAAKTQVNTQVDQLTGGAAKSISALRANEELVAQLANDPKNIEKMQTLAQQDSVLDAQRGLALQASEAYAQSLSQIAADFRLQANREPANSKQLNGEANEATVKATKLLKALGTTDSDYGVAMTSASDSPTALNDKTLNQKRIEEEIRQLGRGEVINTDAAKGTSASSVAAGAINEAIFGKTYHQPLTVFGQDMQVDFNVMKAARPFEVGSNIAIDGLNAVGDKSPILKFPTSAAAGMIDWFVQSPNDAMPGAAKNLAHAREADPVAANKEMDKQKKDAIGSMVSTVADVVSGQIGVAAPKLAEKLVSHELLEGNVKTRAAVGIGLGLMAAAGSRWAEDELSHSLLGTKKMTGTEILTHAASGLVSAHVANALGARFPGDGASRVKNYASLALTSGATNSIYGLGQANPFVQNAKTGHNYTVGETAKEGATNFIYGAAAGPAGKLLAGSLKQGTIGLASLAATGLKAGAKWTFNSHAGEVLAKDAAEATVNAATKAAEHVKAPILPEWTQGVMGTSFSSTGLRAVSGYAAGATGSFAFVNPWTKDADTGANYTWEDSLSLSTQVGVLSAATFAGARLPDMTAGMALRASDKILPNEGAVWARAFGSNLTATGYRAGVGGVTGFGLGYVAEDKADANGRAYTQGELLSRALNTGAEWSLYSAVTPLAAKALFKPGDNPTLNSFMSSTVSGTAKRFGVGAAFGTTQNLMFSDKTDADGKALSYGQIGENALISGAEFGAVAATAPLVVNGFKWADLGGKVNYARRGLGQAADATGSYVSDKVGAVAGKDTTIGRVVVAPTAAMSASAHAFTDSLIKPQAKAAAKTGLAFAAPLSDAASDAYRVEKLHELDEQAKAVQKQEEQDYENAMKAQQQQ